MKKIIFFVVFIIISLGAYAYLEKETFYGTLSYNNTKKDFEILKGESFKDVGEKLEKENLIKNKYFFYYYLWKTENQGKIQAGFYELAPNMNQPEIVRKFVAGDIKVNTVKITIPEGYNNKKIIELIKEKTPNLAKEFEEIVICQCVNKKSCACDKFSEKYQFLQELPKGANLEGYLFPDTYFISENETGATLVSKFLNNYKNKISGNFLESIIQQKKNLHQVMTMASIIEREVKTEKDRNLVSGIFWQRLADNYPLQSCATLAYFLGIDKPKFSYEDTRVKSPYNTYINKGLPPGPISNPGLDSIRAAIYPEKSDYYYFLSDPKTGVIIYSKTSEEHAENKTKHGL